MTDKINEFEFYKKLAEPLILYLPNYRDRYFGAAWLKKLEDQDLAEESLRISYLKLLLLSLQRGKLMGIFSDNPISYKVLIDFRNDFDIHEFAKCMIERENETRRNYFENQINGKIGVAPPVYFDYSSSLQEYTAAQDIPNFGVHSYYAFSSEPFTKWQRSEKVHMPYAIPDTSNIKHSACYCTDKMSGKLCATIDEAIRKRIEAVKRPAVLLGIVEDMFREYSYPLWGSNIMELHNITKKSSNNKLLCS